MARARRAWSGANDEEMDRPRGHSGRTKGRRGEMATHRRHHGQGERHRDPPSHRDPSPGASKPIESLSTAVPEAAGPTEYGVLSSGFKRPWSIFARFYAEVSEFPNEFPELERCLSGGNEGGGSHRSTEIHSSGRLIWRASFGLLGALAWFRSRVCGRVARRVTPRGGTLEHEGAARDFWSDG